MDEPHDRSLAERVERLERAVEELRDTLGRLDGVPTRKGTDISREVRGPAAPPEALREPAPDPLPKPPEPIPPAWESSSLSDIIGESESWLGRIGIGLLLFALVFLFKYAIDSGWLIPSVRVGFGLALGIGLIVAAVRIHPRRRPFAQIPFGGGMASGTLRIPIPLRPPCSWRSGSVSC